MQWIPDVEVPFRAFDSRMTDKYNKYHNLQISFFSCPDMGKFYIMYLV